MENTLRPHLQPSRRPSQAPFFPSREPRLSRAVPLQLCPVTCCPSSHGKETHSCTTKHGPRTRVEMHCTGLLEVQGPDQWLGDSSLHICPVCSRLISSRTRPCCPSSWNDPHTPTDLTGFDSNRTSGRQVKRPRHVAFWPPDRFLVPPETRPPT